MALTLLAANNAQTVLAAGISASATSLTVNSGTGSLFPAPSAGVSFFKLTLIDAATGQLTEIMHVTARTGDTMTIERGQEGTTARAWSANDIAANMMTAGTLSYLLTNFQPLDPTLTAIAALVGAANKLPYFNGPDRAALTDLTAVGRDIIGKNTIADILTYLGLDTALAAKQPLDATLTGLSGKNDAGLRAYLSLKSAATCDVGSLLGQLPGMDLFSSTIAGTGEKAIPDFNTGTGMFILKWGAIAAPTTSQDITTLFQTPFPNKCLRVFAIADYSPGTGNVMYVSVNNSTLKQDRFVTRFAGSANYTSGVYLALGY